MDNRYLIVKPKPRNFGIITEFSKDLNDFFGDYSGRSVSMRTAHGFKRALNLYEIDDNTAEDFVHVGMTLVPVLLNRKNDTADFVGTLIAIGLLGCYWHGK